MPQHTIRSLAQKVSARIGRMLHKRHDFLRDDPAYAGFTIGRYTYGRPLVMGAGEAELSIGSFCSIAEGVRILLGGNHRTDWVTTYPFPKIPAFAQHAHLPGHPASKGPVRIGNDVWIGQDALILSGVTIGDGAVIGARSVVTKDVPPYAVAAGNPARVVKQRFSDEETRELLELRWWGWPIERIEALIPLMLSPDIRGFLEAARRGPKAHPPGLE